jgi:hypothetical protein
MMEVILMNVVAKFRVFYFQRLKKWKLFMLYKDTQTLWEEYGGSSTDFNKVDTICVILNHCWSLNHEEFMIQNYMKSLLR